MNFVDIYAKLKQGNCPYNDQGDVILRKYASNTIFNSPLHLSIFK